MLSSRTVIVTVTSLLLCTRSAVSQQIFDIYTTTWDRTSQFKYTNLATPINFVTPGAAAAADIVINDATVYQTVDGFGATLTDTAASTLLSLKSKNVDNYWSVLGFMFDPTDSKQAAGLGFLRVTLAASDLSASVYSFDDTSGDTSLSKFSISSANNIITVIKDILTVNSALKVHLVSWSPPAWMKSPTNMKGGTINSAYYSTYANYLLKALQGFKSNGITAYSIAIQNEPQNGDTTYPTCTMSPAVEGAIGQALRTLMNNNGFGNTKLIGYEHNWDNAATYPVQLMSSYGSAFAGVAFHCYLGSVGQQDSFHSAQPNKEIYHTECTGTVGSDYWSDIKWYIDNLFIGAIEHNARTAAMWNLAADANGNPKLPGTDSCPGGCRPLVTIDSNGGYNFNQEFWAMAQASKAIVPKDAGGPTGKRIAVSVQGGSSWALRVGAYVTARKNSADWLRYSLVVLNWNDSSSTNWNPQAVAATIEFRGLQAKYTFPVGVTTLWWYAANQGHTRRNGTEDAFETTVYAEHDGKVVKPRKMRWERN